MKLLFYYLKQNKRVLLMALALTAIHQISSLVDPQIFRFIIDNYASRAHLLSLFDFLRGIILLLLASMGVALIARTAKHMQSYYVNVATQRVGANVYANSIKHVLSLPYGIFVDQRSGELLQKLQKARLDVQNLILGFINVAFLSLVGASVVIFYAFWVHWIIGLAYTSVIPVLGTINFLISKRIKKVQKKIVLESAGLAGSTTETLRNIELVKSLGLDQQEVKRLNDVNNRILGLEFKKIRLVRSLNFIQDSFINVMRTLILFIMLWLIFQKGITVGEFFTLFIYSFFIFNPISELGIVASQYQETKASLEVIQNLMESEPEKKPAKAIALGPITSINFDNVSFAYGDKDNLSVKDINLTIASGDTVAFVGLSGSGKTTLVKLIPGLYQPTEGTILVNRINTNNIDYDDLRKRIGYVSQETQLFAGTIRENLLFVSPEATDKECLDAIQQASALTILERGGRGLDTRIGEGGIKLSGGERQRVAIARALLRKPELIIFDEATSDLDSITEKAITATIKDIGKTRSNLMTILVAHRLSTVIHADKIYVLEKGKVTEQGRHTELLQKGGLYAALWREQGGNNIE